MKYPPIFLPVENKEELKNGHGDQSSSPSKEKAIVLADPRNPFVQKGIRDQERNEEILKKKLEDAHSEILTLK